MRVAVIAIIALSLTRGLLRFELNSVQADQITVAHCSRMGAGGEWKAGNTSPLAQQARLPWIKSEPLQ